MPANSIVLIGSGNMAFNLGTALYKAGYNISCVHSIDHESGSRLARKLGSTFTGDLSRIPSKAGFYLLCVPDDIIPQLAAKLNTYRGCIVHTSGTVNIDVFNAHKGSYGVLYPLMVFNAKKIISFSGIPTCIEGSNAATLKKLNLLAGSISKTVHKINSNDRKIIHLAAVFACNFSNLNYTIAEALLKAEGLPFGMLHPLIKETAEKTTSMSPVLAQTGPASRNDIEVIDQHKALLSGKHDLKKMYELLTGLIIKNKKNGTL